jgi:hypothetical protein
LKLSVGLKSDRQAKIITICLKNQKHLHLIGNFFIIFIHRHLSKKGMGMKKALILVILFVQLAYASQPVQWAVIGAGPAGITSVMNLLENGVSQADIIWIDPEFSVGRLGKFYGHVPSNQTAGHYMIYFSSCLFFNRMDLPRLETLKKYDQNKEPYLQLLIDPLQDVTNFLRKHVTSYQDNVSSLTWENDSWTLCLTDIKQYARKVILATGSYPRRLDYNSPEEIPLDIALDEDKLKKLVSPDDSIMVIGSAHSAMLILKYLSDIPIKKIINIYSKLPSYGGYAGLLGITAYWTKEVLEENPPAMITRLPLAPGVIEANKDQCNKIIYAFGYERNPLRINGQTNISFDSETGKIAPHLYGIGIAFPEKYTMEDGAIIDLIGIVFFMEYAQKLMPAWIKE